MQLVVYAGGTLILIVFGVMLTSKSPYSRFEPKLGEIVIAISMGLVLLIALIAGILRTKFADNPIDTTVETIQSISSARRCSAISSSRSSSSASCFWS